MKRIFVLFCTVLVLGLSASTSQASWGYVGYSGYQPWWNLFAKRYKCLTPEEERLQKFWHDYYDAMEHFYKALDHIDWVAYYKNHGYQINAACGGGGGQGCCGRINYAPVFVSPTLQWAVPAGCSNGPPVGPGCATPCCGPGGPGYGPGPGPGYGPGPGPMPMYGDPHAGTPGMSPMYAGGPSYPMGASYPGSAFAFGGYPSTGYPSFGSPSGPSSMMAGSSMPSAPATMPSVGSPSTPGSTPAPMPSSPVSTPMPGAD